MQKLKTIFCGTPEMVLPVLSMLKDHLKIDLIQIVTPLDKKAGRGLNTKKPATAIFAKNNKIDLLQTDNINNDIDKLKETDLLIVFAFSQFLKQKVLDLPKKGAFNIHTSLLPKYRGASPIHYALLNNDKETGVTIQKMALKMDSGDIAISKTIPILDKDTYITLSDKLKNLAPKTLEEFIDNFDTINYIAQGDNYSLSPRIQKEEGIIDKDTTYLQFLGKFNAFIIWPKVSIVNSNIPIKIIEFDLSSFKLEPGKLFIKNNKLLYGLKDETIQIRALQLPSKGIWNEEQILSGCNQLGISL